MSSHYDIIMYEIYEHGQLTAVNWPPCKLTAKQTATATTDRQSTRLEKTLRTLRFATIVYLLTV